MCLHFLKCKNIYYYFDKKTFMIITKKKTAYIRISSQIKNIYKNIKRREIIRIFF